MRRWTGWIAVGALALSACGGGGDEVDAGAGEVSQESFTTTPMAVAMGYADFDEAEQGAMQERFVAEERERQEIIAECMREQGFEYTAQDPSQFMGFESGDMFDGLEPGTREFAERFGYGNSTTIEQQMSQSVDQGYEDPNQEYVESLPESGRAAFYEALHGEQPEYDPTSEDGGEEAMVWEPSGCEGEAYEATGNGFGAGLTDEDQQDFQELMTDLYERVEADPRIASANEEWAACMGEAGYAFSKQEDVWEAMDERMQPLFESQNPFGDRTDEEIAALSEEEMQELFDAPPAFDPVLLAEAQEFEIAVAVADFDCQRPLMAARLEVQVELEQQVVDANGDLLARIREAQQG